MVIVMLAREPAELESAVDEIPPVEQTPDGTRIYRAFQFPAPAMARRSRRCLQPLSKPYSGEAGGPVGSNPTPSARRSALHGSAAALSTRASRLTSSTSSARASQR